VIEQAVRLEPTPASRTAPTLRRGLIAVFVVALLVRIAIVLATPHFVPQTDSADYDREAVSLADHGVFPNSLLSPSGGPTAFRPPVFPLVLAAVYEISGTGSQSARWEAGRIAEAVLGALTVALVYLLALRLFGPAPALIAGAVSAVYPPFVLVGSSLMSESLFIPLVLGAVLTGLVGRDSPHRYRCALLAGVLVGLAALTRSIGIAMAVPVALLLWQRHPRWSWRSVAVPLAMLAVALGTLVPWTIRNAVVLHSFVPVSTENGFALAGTYNSVARARRDYPALWAPPVVQLATVAKAHPRYNEAQVSNSLTSVGLRYAEAHPGYVAVVALWSAVRMLDLQGPGLERYAATFEAYPAWLATVSVYAFWIVGTVALAGTATRVARRAPPALWLAPALLFAVTILFSGGTRYRAPEDPFVVMLAALALGAAWRRLRATPSP
jgi:4-amino-4-deoxy-L-arabinose transferase-like glycosyltransferase